MNCVIRFAAALIVMVLFVAGCGHNETEPTATDSPDHEDASVMSNRIAIPSAVRTNLGITFAEVERRAIAQTLRVPGRFEYRPTARHEYRLPLNGRVNVLVEQYADVDAGEPLYELDSPDWQSLQNDIESVESQIRITSARLEALDPIMEAHVAHEEGVRQAVELWIERVEQLEVVAEAGGGRAAELAQARINLNEARSSFGELQEKDAELRLRLREHESELESANARRDLLLRTAASVLGVSRAEIESKGSSPDDVPRWKRTSVIVIEAANPGVVEHIALTNGAWANANQLAVSTVDPTAIRFRAAALQSDLPTLQSKLPARVVPPRGGQWDPNDAVDGQLVIGLHADPDERTVDLLFHPNDPPPWARDGVVAFLEVTLDETAGRPLAIPMSCVVRDGITPVIFRRDPNDPNAVIRLKADLGLDDGRWMVINSGVGVGDEIVLDGAYQLMLATSGSVQQGGHFHADGTFHAEDH